MGVVVPYGHMTHEGDSSFYPADLQEKAQKMYEALPESGTTAELFEAIKRSGISGDESDSLACEMHAATTVGWKEKSGDHELVKMGIVYLVNTKSRVIFVQEDTSLMSHDTRGSRHYTPLHDDYQSSYSIRWQIEED